MALLWPHLAVPPLPSPRPPSVAIPASGVGMGLQLAPDDGPAQPLYFFLQGATVARALWWASLTSASLLSAEVSLFPLLGVLLLRGWTLTGSGSSIVWGGLFSFCPRWSSREDATSAMSSSIHSGSPGADPSSLQSLHTL